MFNFGKRKKADAMAASMAATRDYVVANVYNNVFNKEYGSYKE